MSLPANPAFRLPGRAVRTALPVPPLGAALGDEGDAYVCSLEIAMTRDDGEKIDTEGHVLEALMDAAGVRHLAFHPRTRALVPGTIRCRNLVVRIEKNWSRVESMGIETVELAQDLFRLAASEESIAWSQTN